jgi:hypothetical protein
MQVLTCLVTKAVEEEIVRNLAGITAMQRISIYADDVVVFLKPLPQELIAIKRLFEMFGEASGLQVNYTKTSATLIRGTETLGLPSYPFPNSIPRLAACSETVDKRRVATSSRFSDQGGTGLAARFDRESWKADFGQVCNVS